MRNADGNPAEDGASDPIRGPVSDCRRMIREIDRPIEVPGDSLRMIEESASDGAAKNLDKAKGE